MKFIDRGLAILLLVGGGGHVYGSIESYRSEPKALLWALCGSVLVWLISGLNILRTYRPGDAGLAWLSIIGTTSWLCVSVVFGFLINNPLDPRVVSFEVVTLGLIFLGLRGALRGTFPFPRQAGAWRH